MMTETEIALGVTVINLIGQAINAWLKTRISAEIAARDLNLREWITEEFLPRELADERFIKRPSVWWSKDRNEE